MNIYISKEPLVFTIKSEGKDSSDAYERHCEVISAIIDAARKAGADIEDDSFGFELGTKIYRIEDGGDAVEVQGWIDGSKDDEGDEEKS